MTAKPRETPEDVKRLPVLVYQVMPEGDGRYYSVKLARTSGQNESPQWKIVYGVLVLNKRGDWIPEPVHPTPAYLVETRFDSAQAALGFYQAGDYGKWLR